MRALIYRATLFASAMLSCLVPAAANDQIQNGVHAPRQPETMQQAHAIGLALFSYANDHNGAYPTGNSSTEVFQKLIDGGYVNDSIIFFVPMPGKVKPTSNKLKPENVSFDVTGGVDLKSSDTVPLLFQTGFILNYSPGSDAEPASEDAGKRDGMVIYYHSNSAQFLKKNADGTIHNAVPTSFDDKGYHYQQLTPDGPAGLA